MTKKVLNSIIAIIGLTFLFWVGLNILVESPNNNPFGSKTKVAGVVERLKENVSLFSGGLIKFCGALRIVIFAWLLDEFSMATTTPVYIELLSSGNTE